jgi:hypothetical protein
MAITKRNPATGIPQRPTTNEQTEARRPTPPPPEPDDYDTPVKSPDELYDEVIYSSKDAGALEPGRYEAILNSLVALPPKDTGGFIRAEFIIADPDPKLMGRRHSVLFQMIQADGRTPGEWGHVFYNRMMAKLGYPTDHRGAPARRELTEEKPGVYLKLSPGKQEGFVNTAVEGRFNRDNDNITALREFLDQNPY